MVMNNLKSELPQYMAAADGVIMTVDVVLWWKGHEHELPHWASAFKLIALVQPSSAACERVFSLLTNAFSSQQKSAMEDYISLSVMLQYSYQ